MMNSVNAIKEPVTPGLPGIKGSYHRLPTPWCCRKWSLDGRRSYPGNFGNANRRSLPAAPQMAIPRSKLSFAALASARDYKIGVSSAAL